MCRSDFGPEDTSQGRPVLYRCIHCSDFSSGDAKASANRCLHLCTSCHGKAGLYHASSHCWAKVFVNTARGAYDYKKGTDWIGKVSAVATQLTASNQSIESPGTSHLGPYGALNSCSTFRSPSNPFTPVLCGSLQVFLRFWTSATIWHALDVRRASTEPVGSR